MYVPKARVFALLGICTILASCEPLDLEKQKEKGELQIAATPTLDAIPKEFGRVLGVTPRSDAPDVANLWFEKPDGTIIAVGVNCQYGRLSKKYIVIPRR